jgi:ABC-type nitrate/sulfonate/bicarbonate transport system ATPase subunit
VRLDVRDVTKRFRRADGRTLDVLDRVSFAVEPRGFVCLVGPSGAGKSTILNLLAGLLTPDGGEIRVDGQPFDPARHRIGYVFQKPRLLNWRSVRQNVEFALDAARVDRASRADRVRSVLALVGLEQFADEYPLALSGGMQQRVAIARAVAIEPELLLMDEPFSHLDELTARAQRRELLRFRDKIEASVVFVTHNALEAVYLGDRVCVLSARPSRIVTELAIDGPRTRGLDDPTLVAWGRDVLRALGVE